MRSPYGHPQAFSTSGTGVRVEIGSGLLLEADYYAASNIALTGLSTTLDGATLTEGKIIWAPNQSTGTQDGPYVVDVDNGDGTCELVRVPGFKVGDKINPGTVFRIRSGSTYGGARSTVQGTAPLTLGTDAITAEIDPDASVLAGTGGAGLVGILDTATYYAASTVEAALAEIAVRVGGTGGLTNVQIATGTLVSGTKTISTGITVTANSYVIPILTTAVTGSTNFACLHNLRASNTTGAPGVGAIVVQALGADGALDTDAAGSFVAVILN